MLKKMRKDTFILLSVQKRAAGLSELLSTSNQMRTIIHAMFLIFLGRPGLPS